MLGKIAAELGKYGNRTDHVFVLGEDIGYPTTNNNSTNPSSNESLDSFLRGETDKRSPAPKHAANIRKYIIRDDETHRKKQPYQALENGVDDKVGLENNEEKGHMRPTELRELIGISARRQRHNEKHEAYNKSKRSIIIPEGGSRYRGDYRRGIGRRI